MANGPPLFVNKAPQWPADPRCSQTRPLNGSQTPAVRKQGPSMARRPPLFANKAPQWPADPRCSQTRPLNGSQTPAVREHCRKIEQN